MCLDSRIHNFEEFLPFDVVYFGLRKTIVSCSVNYDLLYSKCFMLLSFEWDKGSICVWSFCIYVIGSKDKTLLFNDIILHIHFFITGALSTNS